MIKRLWHLIVGHQWTEERMYMPASHPNRMMLWNESDYHERYGFTQIVRFCECGAKRRMRLVGDFTAYPAGDDVKELRRMAKL